MKNVFKSLACAASVVTVMSVGVIALQSCEKEPSSITPGERKLPESSFDRDIRVLIDNEEAILKSATNSITRGDDPIDDDGDGDINLDDGLVAVIEEIGFQMDSLYLDFCQNHDLAADLSEVEKQKSIVSEEYCEQMKYNRNLFDSYLKKCKTAEFRTQWNNFLENTASKPTVDDVLSDDELKINEKTYLAMMITMEENMPFELSERSTGGRKNIDQQAAECLEDLEDNILDCNVEAGITLICSGFTGVGIVGTSALYYYCMYKADRDYRKCMSRIK